MCAPGKQAATRSPLITQLKRRIHVFLNKIMKQYPNVIEQDIGGKEAYDSTCSWRRTTVALGPMDINLQGQIPRAEFAATKFDFGDIYRGQVVSHSFSFQNKGNGTLVLNNIHSTCGCTNTRITREDGKTEKNVFKPQEAGLLWVDFDSSAFSGNIVRTMTLETNMGSSSPTITFTLYANVKQEIESKPALLYVGTLQKSKSKSFSVDLNLFKRADRQGLVKAFGVESTSEAIQAVLSDGDGDKTARIQVTARGDKLPVGAFHSNLIVKNNSVFDKDFVIPVVGEVASSVQMSAKYVEFGVIRQGNSSLKKMTFRSSHEDFDLTSVKVNFNRIADMPGLGTSDLFDIKKEKISFSSGSSDDSEANFGYAVTFKFRFPKKIDWSQSESNVSEINVSGNFIVKTNDPDYKEITVPFFGVLRKNNHESL